MKKLFAMAVAMLTATSMFAQPEAGTITIAPKAGIAISSSNGDGTKSKVGFIGGVEAGYQIADPFAVTLGVNYAQYGYKAEGTDAKVNMNYIAVPVLFNYYPVQGLAIKAGIEVDFKASAKIKAGDLEVDMDDYFALSRSDIKTNGAVMSIPVGASYEYNNIILDARYNIGITNQFKNIPDGYESAKLSQFVITLGYKFAL